MQDFHDLKVWEKAHQLTLEIYRATRTFPQDELYGLTSQLRRASSSIAANIAEGCGRNSGPDLRRFLGMALGSASEVEYHLLLAHDLGLLDQERHAALNREICEIKRMLTVFIQKLTPPKTLNRRSKTEFV